MHQKIAEHFQALWKESLLALTQEERSFYGCQDSGCREIKALSDYLEGMRAELAISLGRITEQEGGEGEGPYGVEGGFISKLLTSVQSIDSPPIASLTSMRSFFLPGTAPDEILDHGRIRITGPGTAELVDEWDEEGHIKAA